MHLIESQRYNFIQGMCSRAQHASIGGGTDTHLPFWSCTRWSLDYWVVVKKIFSVTAVFWYVWLADELETQMWCGRFGPGTISHPAAKLVKHQSDRLDSGQSSTKNRSRETISQPGIYKYLVGFGHVLLLSQSCDWALMTIHVFVTGQSRAETREY